MASVYDIITERVMEQLARGVVPWRKPWATDKRYRFPLNMSSGKPYRGINVFLLASQGYDSPLWLTFNQAKSFGGNVRKGERGTPVVFWQWPDEKAKEKARAAGKQPAPIVRYYTVFNVAQCDGLPEVKTAAAKDERTTAERIAECEALVAGIENAPTYREAPEAWYRPADDVLGMPAFDKFHSPEAYYATLFHELTHATGHDSRLGRLKNPDANFSFGSETYAKEELVAEMGAAMLCGVTGIVDKTLDQSASYIAGWLKALKNDKTLVVYAAAQAQKAADWLRGENGSSSSGDEE